MSAGKWAIYKRPKDAKYSDIWPWLLTYPNGGQCNCFTFRSAVDQMRELQRALLSEKRHFGQMKDRFAAGPAREKVLV